MNKTLKNIIAGAIMVPALFFGQQAYSQMAGSFNKVEEERSASFNNWDKNFVVDLEENVGTSKDVVDINIRNIHFYLDSLTKDMRLGIYDFDAEFNRIFDEKKYEEHTLLSRGGGLTVQLYQLTGVHTVQECGLVSNKKGKLEQVTELTQTFASIIFLKYLSGPYEGTGTMTFRIESSHNDEVIFKNYVYSSKSLNSIIEQCSGETYVVSTEKMAKLINDFFGKDGYFDLNNFGVSDVGEVWDDFVRSNNLENRVVNYVQKEDVLLKRKVKRSYQKADTKDDIGELIYSYDVRK